MCSHFEYAFTAREKQRNVRINFQTGPVRTTHGGSTLHLQKPNLWNLGRVQTKETTTWLLRSHQLSSPYLIFYELLPSVFTPFILSCCYSWGIERKKNHLVTTETMADMMEITRNSSFVCFLSGLSQLLFVSHCTHQKLTSFYCLESEGMSHIEVNQRKRNIDSVMSRGWCKSGLYMAINALSESASK